MAPSGARGDLQRSAHQLRRPQVDHDGLVVDEGPDRQVAIDLLQAGTDRRKQSGYGHRPLNGSGEHRRRVGAGSLTDLSRLPASLSDQDRSLLVCSDESELGILLDLVRYGERAASTAR